MLNRIQLLREPQAYALLSDRVTEKLPAARPMNPVNHPPSVGFVPSIEVLPFLAWADGSGITPRACAGYGHLVRAMLTGELEGGLLPFELAVADLLMRPGQRRGWNIPAVLKAGPVEPVLSHAAYKKISPSSRRRLHASPISLALGVEARVSFARQQLVRWQQNLGMSHLTPPSFKVLPFSLMMKALEKAEIDGFLAPAPWGLQAEKTGLGRIASQFDEGEFAQHLVLVDRHRDPSYDPYSRLPAELPAFRAVFSDPAATTRAVQRMTSLGGPTIDPHTAWQAVERYPLDTLPDEFAPDESWFARQLEILAGRYRVSVHPGLAGELVARQTDPGARLLPEPRHTLG